MSSSKPVIFVQPPTSFDNHSPCLDDKQFGLGILANSAWLESHGFEVHGVHIPLSLHYGFSAEDVTQLIAAYDPLLIAIGLNWVHFSDGAIETARRLKTLLPVCPIVLGGQHASLFSEEISARHVDCVDGVIMGEAEIPLLTICNSLRETNTMPEDLAGLVRAGRKASPPDVVIPMDDLPIYRYSALRPNPLQTDVAAISTTRGACPYNCAWCIEPVIGRLQGRPRLQFHSASRIADQFESLMRDGITRFTIQDNFFVGGDAKLAGLADELMRRGLRPKHINVFAHPESFTETSLRALAECCDRASVDYGVETGSLRVASLNHRRLDTDQVVDSIATTANSNVEPFTWWMVGLPGEDDKALSETEDLILRTLRVGGVPRWVSPLILFPKTPIHETPDQFGVTPRFRGFDDYSAFSRTTLAEAVLFSDTVTHETSEAGRDDITRASGRLRRFIADHLSELETFYDGHRLQPDLSSVRNRVLQSFF